MGRSISQIVETLPLAAAIPGYDSGSVRLLKDHFMWTDNYFLGFKHRLICTFKLCTNVLLIITVKRSNVRSSFGGEKRLFGLSISTDDKVQEIF